MTSLLANLDETIKTKNQEDKNTRYLAICKEYIEADNHKQKPWMTPYYSLQAWVIVNQNATLVFFLNTNFKVGVLGKDDDTSYVEGDGCKKVISLDEYIYNELKEKEKNNNFYSSNFDYLNRTIQTFLNTKFNPKKSEKGPGEVGWGEVAHELFEQFKKRYIHKFIAHTYDDDYIAHVDKLYDFYVLVYKPPVGDNEYIKRNCSRLFSLYIDIKNNKVHFGILETKKGDKINWIFKKIEAQDLNLLNKYIYIYNSSNETFEKINIITGVENTVNTGKIIFDKEKINQDEKALTLDDNLKKIKNAGGKATIKTAYCKILKEYQEEFQPGMMPYSSNLYKYETKLIDLLSDENIKHGDCIIKKHEDFFKKIQTFNQKYSEPIYIYTGKTYVTKADAVKTFGFFSKEDNAYILFKDWEDSFTDDDKAIEFVRLNTKTKQDSDKLFKDLFDTQIDHTLLDFLEKIVTGLSRPSIEHKINPSAKEKLKKSLREFFIKNIEKNINNPLFNKLFFEWYPFEYFEKSVVDAPITLEFLENTAKFKWNDDNKYLQIKDFMFEKNTHMLKIYTTLIKNYSEKPLLIQVIIKSLNDYITQNRIGQNMDKSLIQEIEVYCFVIEEIKKILNDHHYKYSQLKTLKTLITTLEQKIKQLVVNEIVLSNTLKEPESDLDKTLKKLEEILRSLNAINNVISDLTWINDVIQNLKTEIENVSTKMKLEKEKIAEYASTSRIAAASLEASEASKKANLANANLGLLLALGPTQ